MRPSAKVVCARRASSMILPPPLGAIFAQQLLVDFADLLQSLAHAVEVLQLLTDLRDLSWMDADLAVFGARVVDVEHPLEVPLAAGTRGAGDRRGMKGVTFEERSAKDRVKRRKTGKKLAGFRGASRRFCLSHPYRCYNTGAALSIHLCKKMFGGVECPRNVKCRRRAHPRRRINSLTPGPLNTAHLGTTAASPSLILRNLSPEFCAGK